MGEKMTEKSSAKEMMPIQVPQIIQPDDKISPASEDVEKAALGAYTGIDPENPRQSAHLSVHSRPYNYRKESFEVTSDRPSLDSEEGDRTFSTQDDTTITADRPSASRGTTVASTGTRSLPPLRRIETKLAQKEAHPWQHLGITLGLPMVILFDLVVPCIVYYTWYMNQGPGWQRQCQEEYPNQTCPIPRPQHSQNIMGYAIICFGFGEVWILLARIYRLIAQRNDCAPLLSHRWWELDATSWVYGVAVLMALVPFVVASTKELPKLYLYSPTFIMGFLGILMIITTLCPFPIPIGINSQPRDTRLRPFIYYAAEDFIAVDGLQDREFRERYNERYETNAMFRRFFFNLTLWWLLGVCVYIGGVSAIIWTLEFHYAFGASFGFLFSYIVCWAAVTYFWVQYEMQREHLAYEAGEIDGQTLDERTY